MCRVFSVTTFIGHCLVFGVKKLVELIFCHEMKDCLVFADLWSHPLTLRLPAIQSTVYCFVHEVLPRVRRDDVLHSHVVTETP